MKNPLQWRIILICLGIALFFANPTLIGNDQIMLLKAGELLFNGARPYVDFIDQNPPLIYYLNVIPAFLTHLFDLRPGVAFLVLVFLLTLITASLLKNIFSASRRFSKDEWKVVDAAWFVIPILLILVKDFGQREHLFALTFMPYFFLRLHRSEADFSISTTKAITIGALCALMALFKPHFVFVVLVFEIGLLISERNKALLKSPEVSAFFFTALTYLLHFLFLPADIFNAYFKELLPLLLKHYHALNKSPLEFLTISRLAFLQLFVLGILVGLSWKHLSLRTKKLYLFFFGITLAAAAIYIWQMKAWEYQQIPMLYPMVILFLLLTFNYSHELSDSPRVKRKSFLALSFLFWGMFLWPMIDTVRPIFKPRPNTPVRETFSFVQRALSEILSPRDRVVMFTAGSYFMYSNAFYRDYFPGTRYMSIFPLAFFNNRFEGDPTQVPQYKTFEQMPPDEQTFVSRIQEDILNNKPQMLAFISMRSEWTYLPYYFDTFKYFETNGSWDKWKSHYELARTQKDVHIYRRKQD
ncbi:MAG: hypothetical protein AB7O96_08880 [Pseudobdellovibrionaceae bacterium]